jgi:hypothetical protein
MLVDILQVWGNPQSDLDNKVGLTTHQLTSNLVDGFPSKFHIKKLEQPTSHTTT